MIPCPICRERTGTGHVEFNEIVRPLDTVRRSGHPVSLSLSPNLSFWRVALNRNESTSISISSCVWTRFPSVRSSDARVPI